MAFRKTEWPEVGELVIATVNTVTDYGAYVRLDEYNKEGLLHISEISSSWIRNIRNHVREGQKVVLKVLRVDTEKRHIDLSLRRVTRHAKKAKLLLWKKDRRADTILKIAAKKLEITPDEVFTKALSPLEEKFGSLSEGLERVAKEGTPVLLSLNVPKSFADVIAEVVTEKIRIPMVKIKGIFDLRSSQPNGVESIRKALLTARRVEKAGDVEVSLYVVSPPRYRIEVFAEDYKKAEKALEKATEHVVKEIENVGGKGSFKREK